MYIFPWRLYGRYLIRLLNDSQESYVQGAEIDSRSPSFLTEYNSIDNSEVDSLKTLDELSHCSASIPALSHDCSHRSDDSFQIQDDNHLVSESLIVLNSSIDSNVLTPLSPVNKSPIIISDDISVQGTDSHTTTFVADHNSLNKSDVNDSMESLDASSHRIESLPKGVYNDHCNQSDDSSQIRDNIHLIPDSSTVSDDINSTGNTIDFDYSIESYETVNSIVQKQEPLSIKPCSVLINPLNLNLFMQNNRLLCASSNFHVSPISNNLDINNGPNEELSSDTRTLDDKDTSSGPKKVIDVSKTKFSSKFSILLQKPKKIFS